MIPEVARIAGARRETADTWTLELEAPAGRDAWAPPGPVQHAVCLRRRRGADQHQRQRARRRDAAPHRPRGRHRSSALARLKRGDAVGVRGPFGSAWPVEQAAGSDVLIAAGGLGFAPLRPALVALLARRERYGS